MIDDGHRHLAEQLMLLQARVKRALSHLETARPALKWVRNHAPRHDAHDQSHAQLALEEVLQAIDDLRGFTVQARPPEAKFGEKVDAERDESVRPMRTGTTETRGLKDR